MDFGYKKIETTLSELKKRIVSHSIPIDGFFWRTCGYRTASEGIPKVDGTFDVFSSGCKWADKPDTHAWFIKHVDISLPENEMIRPYLSIETDRDGWNVYNPQFICFIDGVQIQSFDTNHRSAPLYARNGFDLAVYAYSGSMGCNLDFTCRIDFVCTAVEKLYFDMLVPFEMLDIADTDSYQYAVIRRTLLDACDAIDLRQIEQDKFLASVKRADEILSKISANVETPHRTVACVGHSHIDVAWMWTLAQTREKICRTVSTVLSLMDEYPDFVFMESQARLYKYLKEEAPALYARVKQRVAEGRWEVEGAMWVEADCNLTSGESLVRQIVHGKQFFKNEFDVDSRVLWLPDVFGYSAALPQICRKSGISVFLTSKISWNDTNRMPYDAFIWQGIDGSEIFTYFLTAQEYKRGGSDRYTTYVATTDPKYVCGCENRFSQKELLDTTLLTYGWGDGGGGPTKKMLEKLSRLKKDPLICPRVRDTSASDFLLDAMDKCLADNNTPKWVGELYLEYHRGTYTSVGLVKRNNRRAENMLMLCEMLSAAAEMLCGTEYPPDRLHDLWEILLTNQFHDILPGSSIPEVYDVSSRQFSALFDSINEINSKALDAICKSVNTRGGTMVINPHSFAADGYVTIDGKTAFVQNIPPKGYKVVTPCCSPSSVIAADGRIENSCYILEFAPDFSISRLYDKQNRREVLRGVGNRLVAYEDRPFSYSCWNIEEYHKAKPYQVNDVVSAESITDGARGGYRIVRRFMSSTITQYVWLYDRSRRIDFETECDWHEQDLLLKAEFDVDVRSERAIYDIQFGAVSRPTHYNTSWDKAMFEVCGQKFADISDHGYGVALLNDCKYGYSIHGSTMALSLIKCSGYVNEYYDKMKHRFTYSLLPHAGDYREAGVIREAYLLNSPLVAFPVSACDGPHADELSLIKADDNGIIAETLKKAYDGRGYIVRAYEAFDMNTDAAFSVYKDPISVCECDLLENDISAVSVSGGMFTSHFNPREIKTFRIIFGEDI